MEKKSVKKQIKRVIGKKKEEIKPSRRDRRANEAHERKMTGKILKALKRNEEYKLKAVRKSQVKTQVRRSVMRRIVRDNIRKRIAGEHGVSFKRVILQGKVVDGNVKEYSIKKDKQGSRA